MFQSKKIEQIESSINDIKERLSNQTAELSKIHEYNKELQEELDDSRQEVNKITETFKNLGKNFEEGISKINNEVVDLKIFFSGIKKDLANELSTEFSREMKTATTGIIQDLESFRGLKEKIMKIERETEQMNSEIKKFLLISEQIKEADFNLTGYTKVLEQKNRERDDLLNRIDQLERLIAKQRSPKF